MPGQNVSKQETADKLRIQVDKSRLVFGVADCAEILQYGECFFQPTVDDLPRVFEDTYLVVVRLATKPVTGCMLIC